jgi:Zn-dependent protease with chaperone function
MRVVRNFLVATLVPLLTIAFCLFRLWQESGGALSPALVADPFVRFASGGLIDQARDGDTIARFSLVLVAAAGLVAASLAVFVTSFLVSAAVGKNRVAMVAVLPAFSLLVLLATTAFVIADVLLLLGIVWSSASGDHPAVTANGVSFWTVVLGIVGVLTVLGLVGALVRMFHIPAMGVIGLRAQPPDHPKLLALVDDIAKKVDARPPRHVVLGLDVNFFATNAPVHPLGEARLKGETLYLSLPCLRLLSEGELRAVIGHELGHFSGNDTRYSLAFAPAFRGLGEATLEVRKPLWRLPNLLGMLAAERLAYVAFLFHRNHGLASKERELLADQKGASASSATDLASALIKTFIFVQVWALQHHINLDRLRRGRVMRNLCISFAERVRYDAQALRLTELVKDSLQYRTSHPTDQHPSTAERIRALHVPIASVADAAAVGERLYPAAPASAALDDMRFTEEQLTRTMQQIMVGMGVRPADDRHESVNALNNVFCQLFAHMVLADHKLDDREIAVAEAEAETLVPDFDSEGFREFCRDENALADLDHLLEISGRVLTDSGKQQLITLLDHIAKADKKVVSEESAVLAKARRILLG